MIVKMKKVSVVLTDGMRETSLEALRNAGVMHLEEVPKGSGEKLETLKAQDAKVADAISRLDGSVKPAKPQESLDRDAVLSDCGLAIDIAADLEKMRTRLTEIDGALELLEPYGDFEPADLSILGSKGIDILLFEGGEGILRRIQDGGGEPFVIRRAKKTVHAAGVFIGEPPENLVSEAKKLPEYGAMELLAEKERLIRDVEEAEGRRRVLSEKRAEFNRLREALAQDMEYESLLTGIEGEENLCWLTGFVPEDRLEGVKSLAADMEAGLLIRDPDENDVIPTLIRNKPAVRIIEPVFGFLGTLPGYREFDISGYFLAYFSVFFAMIIGDAGYGTLFLAGALALAVKGRGKKLHDAVKLLFVLSIMTVIWGALTGNWFGSRVIAAMGPMKAVTIPAIATYPDLFPGVETDPQKTVMWICFILGLSQLTLANLMNFVRDFPQLKSISHLGWASIIGGLYFLVLNLVINVHMPQFAIYMVAVGFGMVVVFGGQEKGVGFVKGALRGLGGAFNTFLDSISGFSNIISYIRLFAVGMSSFYIASSFNNLAAPMLDGWTVPFGIIVILIGHGLNLVMAILSVVVHGIRLNMLEFSGQLGMEWTGVEYDPFRVRISEKNTRQGVPS